MNGIDSLGLSGTDPAFKTTTAASGTANADVSSVAQPVSAALPGAVSATAQNTSSADAGMDRDQLSRIAEELEHFIGGNQRGLSFHVDEDTGRDVVVVKDIATDEVIRQIPAEEVLELAARLSDLTGMLVETEA
ncbi:flagellar protein FlaG [Ferrimonas balearica]|uniref:flagellar protein FlaG n=1 Tax=Ferrimonas balearica TaxID=44012 RepID=UPI001C57F6B9|nr:flagellar protein FlaG [Ferrimonas balearica]MBW3164302.1 flagellar protein FlaG [Ferrimonas balearica]MBY6225058.1 flagellar protein FlaG [Ferrimonas balearica]